MFSAKTGFDKNLDKATSHLLLEPDWDATLQVCDALRQEDVTAKYALGVIKKKLQDKNPRVGLYALQVLESCVKNCGSAIHEEIATGPFMSDMKDLVNSSNDALKDKAKELLQAWAHAFRNDSSLKIVVDTFSQLQNEGQSFPELKESDAMFVAEKAPEWIDGERCYNCRAEFGMLQRKHHCRHCGQVFCSKCSAKECSIPKFGIERPVRVCDSCHGKLNKTEAEGSTAASTGDAEGDLPAEYLSSPLSQQSQVAPKKNEQEIQEEEELLLALALSLDEEQNKHIIDKEKSGNTSSSTVTTSAPSGPSGLSNFTFNSSSAPGQEQELDPELARYLNRNYWEAKHDENLSSVNPSAPDVPATAPPISQATTSDPSYVQSDHSEPLQNGSDVNDEKQFIQAMSGSINVLVNRMKSDSSRGRSIASDTTVQGLFQTLHNMHPRLVKILQEREEKRAKMEALQDKLAQIRDAREALDALRDEHREKLRLEAEEAERQRQIQMAQKLEIMRRKKQEMLQMQQQKAMIRMQEQERERQIWLDQQRQQMQMRQRQYTTFPGQQFPPQQQQYVSPSPMQYAGGQAGYTGGPQGSLGGIHPVADVQGHPPSGYQSGMYQQQQQLPPGQGGMDAQYQGQQAPSTTYQSNQYQTEGYINPLSSVDYQNGQPVQNPYNMQGIQAALPTSNQQPPSGMQSQPPPQQQQTSQVPPHSQPTGTTQPYGIPDQQQIPSGAPMQQQQMGGYQPPGMTYQGGYAPQQGTPQYGMGGQQGQIPPPQLPPQGQIPPQGQQPPQQLPERQEATLISFD